MGDSNSDGYRADDNNRGGTYASTTLNWDEQLQRYRGIDLGQWRSWNGTRRSGYEYNWAISGATAEDVVSTGQATGLAQQVAAGRINTAVLYVGANNFAIWNDTYTKIYNGVLAGQALRVRNEENRVKVYDPADIAYSIYAKATASRRDNNWKHFCLALREITAGANGHALSGLAAQKWSV
jgi:hypothetical protein